MAQSKRTNLIKLLSSIVVIIGSLVPIIVYWAEIKKLLVSALRWVKWLAIQPEFVWGLLVVILLLLVWQRWKKRHSEAGSHVLSYVPDGGWARIRDLVADGVAWRIMIPRGSSFDAGLIEFMGDNKPSIEDIVREIEVEGPYCPSKECPTELSVQQGWFRYKYVCPLCHYKTIRNQSPAKLANRAMRIARAELTKDFQGSPAKFQKMLHWLYRV